MIFVILTLIVSMNSTHSHIMNGIQPKGIHGEKHNGQQCPNHIFHDLIGASPFINMGR